MFLIILFFYEIDNEFKTYDIHSYFFYFTHTQHLEYFLHIFLWFLSFLMIEISLFFIVTFGKTLFFVAYRDSYTKNLRLCIAFFHDYALLDWVGMIERRSCPHLSLFWFCIESSYLGIVANEKQSCIKLINFVYKYIW
jgi:hypothetical protein